MHAPHSVQNGGVDGDLRISLIAISFSSARPSVYNSAAERARDEEIRAATLRRSSQDRFIRSGKNHEKKPTRALRLSRFFSRRLC